jgi:hypothetical protein
LTKRTHKFLPIRIIVKNCFPSIAPAHHVVARPGIFDSQWSRHDSTLVQTDADCQ